MAQQPSASASPDKASKTTPATVKSDETTAKEMTPGQRNEEATKLVDRYAMWSGAAGFIPVTGVDIVAIGAVQLQMLRRLSQIYNVPFSENSGKSILASLAGSTIPVTSGIGAASLLKAVPVVGTVIATFVSPTIAAGSTYAIGKVFIQHFQSGGTLLDFNPPDYREFLNAQKELWTKRFKKTDKTATTASSETSANTAASNP